MEGQKQYGKYFTWLNSKSKRVCLPFCVKDLIRNLFIFGRDCLFSKKILQIQTECLLLERSSVLSDPKNPLYPSKTRTRNHIPGKTLVRKNQPRKKKPPEKHGPETQYEKTWTRKTLIKPRPEKTWVSQTPDRKTVFIEKRCLKSRIKACFGICFPRRLFGTRIFRDRLFIFRCVFFRYVFFFACVRAWGFPGVRPCLSCAVLRCVAMASNGVDTMSLFAQCSTSVGVQREKL